jgi:arylsulfatase A-like enzyme
MPNRAALVRLLGFFAVLLSCAPPEAPFRPNIVLISVDTLRADRLPTYGYPYGTAPQIARLAERSVVFDNAYTETVHTLAAHTSLLTGLYPDTHGVILSEHSLSETVPTLAEMLQTAGYRTGAFVNAGFLGPKYGLSRGFSEYNHLSDIKLRKKENQVRFGRNASETNALIRKWLIADPSRPFFLFAHYFDVHSDWLDLPYEAPPRFRKSFELPKPSGYRQGDGKRSASPYLQHMNENGLRYSRASLDYIGSLYDGGLAYMDSEIGKLLSDLEETGQLQNTLIVLLADHGEELGDHGKLLHDQVYEESVRIPLLLAFPESDPRTQQQFSPRRIRSSVQITDVLPSIARYVGLDPPPGIQGESLLPLLADDTKDERPVYFRTRSGSQYGVRTGRWKWIEIRGSPDELYDLFKDPGETNNVAPQFPAEATQLKHMLKVWKERTAASRVTPGELRPIGPSLRRELEALGYVE